MQVLVENYISHTRFLLETFAGASAHQQQQQHYKARNGLGAPPALPPCFVHVKVQSLDKIS
jgi:hypothetical protein